MKDKRTVDMKVMSEWVEPKSRVLDLGCGRGVLMEYLKQSLGIEVMGVDLSQSKTHACVKRGLSVYMGDMMEFMEAFPDKHFDYVICSRTIQELRKPSEVIEEALRVSKHLLVGFVNFGYWRNRCSMALKGRRIHNEVFPSQWWQSRPTNPISVKQFEEFCADQGYEIVRKVLLKGNWRQRARLFPNLTCGYALYDLTKGQGGSDAGGKA